MITLRLDKNGGINKGDVQAFEHDNKSEVYIIQLYKNGEIYDLTNKNIELTMVERKRKIGDMVSLPIYNATEGKVKLEVVSDITKQDGIYDFKLTVKDTTGLIETFPSFQVKIENDITDHITGEIVQDKNFTILTEGLKALADYNIYKTNALKVPEIEQDIIEINSQLDNSMNKLNKITTNDNNACPKFCLDFEMYENESLESCKAQIDVVKSFGFKEILICVKHTLTNGTWTDITPINPYDTVKAIIDYASSLGITTIGLKPHFNDNTGTSWFRMESMNFIESWLSSEYKSVLMNLANICIEKKLPYLGVVNEMPYQTGSYQNIWESICNEIKAKGLKTFCCLTVHEYLNNAVCNYVDIIGLNVYPHISSKGLNTSTDESIKAFSKDLRGYNYNDFINKLANRHKDKEIWITEVGCTKNIDALSIPESWSFETENTDNRIQEIFYKGVLGAFTNNLNLNRICFWSSRGAFRFIDNDLIKPLMEDKLNHE